MSEQNGGCPVRLTGTRVGLDMAEEVRRWRDGGERGRVTTAFGHEATYVARYEDVCTLLADSRTFQIGTVPPPPVLAERGYDLDAVARRNAGNLIMMDPPEHTRLRRMVISWFTPKRVERMRPLVVGIIDRALDTMEAAGPPVDLVSMFAKTVPVMAICELLGIQEAEREQFRSRASRPRGPSSPLEELRRLGDAQWITHELIDYRRQHPSDDVIGMLLREHGPGSPADDLTDDEIVGLGNALLVAGHETTTQMLALGTLALLRHPDQLALVRDDPSQVGDAVEELLRYVGVMHGAFVRRAARDTTLGELSIKEGELVLPALAAASRDPKVVDDGDRLDVTRGRSSHAAFGHGPHFCIGAPLARLELREAFPRLLQRFPGLRLAVPESEVDYSDDTVVYGLRGLPVAW